MHPGAPSDRDLALDATAVRRLRRERKVPEQAIRDQIGLTANDWRRILERRDEPRLRELIELAGVLGADPRHLLAAES